MEIVGSRPELDRHLSSRLDGDRVVEHRLYVFPGQLMHETNLVRIHEARIAHHVAVVRQVDRAPSRGRAMVLEPGYAACHRYGRGCRGLGTLPRDV
jgi:hypothetical protein